MGETGIKITLTEREAMALYRMLLRREQDGTLAAKDDEEQQVLWDFQCMLEKKLEPVDELVTHRLI